MSPMISANEGHALETHVTQCSSAAIHCVYCIPPLQRVKDITSALTGLASFLGF